MYASACEALASVCKLSRTLESVTNSWHSKMAPNSRRTFAFWQLSQGLGGSWSQSADLSSLLDSHLVAASQKCQQSQGSGGPCRKTEKSSDLGEGLCRKTQICSHFLVAASQKCQQSQASEGSLSQNGKVVRFGLAFDRRVSKVSTVTGLGESWPRNAELSTLLDLLLERRERLEEGGERREERREEERERKGQRGERRGERRKEREEGGEWREERGTIGDLVPRPNDRVLGPFWVGDG